MRLSTVFYSGLVVCSVLLACGRAAGSDKETAEPARRFARITENLPKILGVAVASDRERESLSKKYTRYHPEVRLARMIEKSEAKVTIYVERRYDILVAGKPIQVDNPTVMTSAVYSFYLRFYGGSWTTIRWEAPVTIDNYTPPFVADIMMAIDTLDAK